jgi:hypothetical protein
MIYLIIMVILMIYSLAMLIIALISIAVVVYSSFLSISPLFEVYFISVYELLGISISLLIKLL